MRALGVMLKSDLAPSTDAADLSARERTARKQQLQRYMGDYKAAADAFEDASRAAGAAERKAPAPPKAGGRGGAPEDAAAAREEEALLARLQAVDFDASLVDERDAAITNIASTIVEVNETMRDLAALVEEQGKDIEVIESNVTEAADRTSKGVDELTTAAKYQKGYRRWILIFILIICAVAGGVTAYVVIQQKQKSK